MAYTTNVSPITGFIDRYERGIFGAEMFTSLMLNAGVDAYVVDLVILGEESKRERLAQAANQPAPQPTGTRTARPIAKQRY